MKLQTEEEELLELEQEHQPIPCGDIQVCESSMEDWPCMVQRLITRYREALRLLRVFPCGAQDNGIAIRNCGADACTKCSFLSSKPTKENEHGRPSSN